MATHHSHFHRSVWTLLFFVALLLSVLYGTESVQYPQNFRRWVHVGTGIIMPGGPIPESEQGMHHIFANEKAVDGYASGNFADGSIIVYELREAQQKSGVISEGERRRVDNDQRFTSIHQHGRMAIRTILGQRSDAGCDSRLGSFVLCVPFEG